MAKRAPRTTPPVVATESFASRRPLRERGVVSISLKTTDGLFFSLYLSRFPCIGEEVFCEGEVYLITRVQHDWLDEYGHAMAGCHAYLTGSWIPDQDDGIKVPRNRRRKKLRNNHVGKRGMASSRDPLAALQVQLLRQRKHRKSEDIGKSVRGGVRKICVRAGRSAVAK